MDKLLTCQELFASTLNRSLLSNAVEIGYDIIKGTEYFVSL